MLARTLALSALLNLATILQVFLLARGLRLPLEFSLVAMLVPVIGSVAAFAIATAYVVVQQARHGYPTISSWPSRFEDVADLAWLAVMLLGADVVVQWIRGRGSRSIASGDG